MSDDLNFHYKRDERLSLPSAPQPHSTGGGGGIFPRGRGVPILFVLVLMAVVLVLRYHPQARATYRAELAGCQVSLRALAAGDDVIAALEIKAGAQAPAGDRLFAIFSAGASEMRLSEVLPAAGSSVTIDGRMIGAGPAREVTCEVSVGGRSTVLRRALDRS